MQPLGPKDVQAALTDLGLTIDITFFEETTATSQQAADQIGCVVGQIVKSIAFIVDGQPILVLTSGDNRVDDRKIATLYGVGRKKVKVAKPDQLVEIYGYEPGAVPPFGHRTAAIAKHLDEGLQRFEAVYAAGGAHNAIFEIPVATLAEVTGAAFTDVRDVRKEDT